MKFLILPGVVLGVVGLLSILGWIKRLMPPMADKQPVSDGWLRSHTYEKGKEGVRFGS